MTRHFVIITLTFLLTSTSHFGQTADPSIQQSNKSYVNKGPSISLGPELVISNETLYGANINFRYWYRTGGAGRVRIDNTFNLTAGYFRLESENLFKFKAGNFILLTSGRYGDIRLGIFADYLLGNTTKIFAIDGNIGLRLPEIYIYIGYIQPVLAGQNDFGIKTGLLFGLDFYIFDRKSYHN